MLKKISVIQWLAWFYALNFLFIFVICHWPGLTDAHGKLLGLYQIDPVDDVFHLLSGLLAVVVALRSRTWSVNYFKYVGIPYGIDAVVGLFFSTQFLNGDVFTKPLGGIDFSSSNLMVNLPHIAILVTMLVIGFWLSKRVDTQTQ
ncbi:MAG: hypothetical protein V4473_01735 [Patescibacteria group bacterium]